MKPQNILYTPLILLFSIHTIAQVGINTDNPRPEVGLDINGNVNVTDRIYLGGIDLSQQGDDGEDKASIVSGGESSSPEWKKLQIPAGFGESFTMTYMNTYYDTTGQDIATVDSDPYNMDDLIDANWKVLTGLNNEFPIYKSGSKANFIFQTTGQITGNGSSSSASFACGLFMRIKDSPDGFKLKGVRTDAVRGAAGSNKIINMNVTLENLPNPGGAGGTIYEVRVACRGRNVQTTFAVGKALNTTFLNQGMAQSTLNVFVLETWQ